MCDSFVALPATTARNHMILAKSADCQVNEAFASVRVPAQRHVPGEVCRVTHLVIPQAPKTYEVLLGKSFWTWGCEMGVNEHGVAIGYEAVFTRAKQEELDGVIPPDLARVGLERGATAREAMDAIVSTLVEFGQGGNCELVGNSHFDGSYLIADPGEAWILETAARDWAAKRLDEPIGSISNFLAIGSDWDESSVSRGVDWRQAYADPEIVPRIGACERQASSYQALAAAEGRIDEGTAFEILRRHKAGYHPATADVHSDVCVHAGPQKHRDWQATGAMVFSPGPNGVTVWHTSTAGNCISIFKPVFLGVELPEMGPMPSERIDSSSLWWMHELLHRRAMADFPRLVAEVRKDFDALEAEFLAAAPAAERGTTRVKREFAEYCFRAARTATDHWIVQLSSRADLAFGDALYRAMWKNYNCQAGVSGLPA